LGREGREERTGEGGAGEEKEMDGPLFKFVNTPLQLETAVCTNNKKA